MSDNTINLARRSMGFDRETATAHGFRAMARTMAAERLGVAPDVIEVQLAHAKSGPFGAACDRAQDLDQPRELMARWTDDRDRLRVGADVIEGFSVAQQRAILLRQGASVHAGSRPWGLLPDILPIIAVAVLCGWCRAG